MRIAATKVEAVEFALHCLALMRQNVGAFGLMANSPFGAENDVLLCCRFAEGDSRVLQQMLTRDLVRAHTSLPALLQLVCQVARAWLSGAWLTRAKLRYLRDLKLLHLLWVLRKRTKQASQAALQECKSTLASRRSGAVYQSHARTQTDAWLDAGELVYDVGKAHAIHLVHSTVEQHFGRSRDTDEFLELSVSGGNVHRGF